MTLAAFKDYLPLSDLAKIVVVALLVALIAPSAAAVSIAGLDRRARVHTHESSLAADGLILVGLVVLFGLAAAGIYTLATD
jgi:hypothetical protein